MDDWRRAPIDEGELQYVTSVTQVTEWTILCKKKIISTDFCFAEQYMHSVTHDTTDIIKENSQQNLKRKFKQKSSGPLRSQSIRDTTLTYCQNDTYISSKK